MANVEDIRQRAALTRSHFEAGNAAAQQADQHIDTVARVNLAIAQHLGEIRKLLIGPLDRAQADIATNVAEAGAKYHDGMAALGNLALGSDNASLDAAVQEGSIAVFEITGKATDSRRGGAQTYLSGLDKERENMLAALESAGGNFLGGMQRNLVSLEVTLREAQVHAALAEVHLDEYVDGL